MKKEKILSGFEHLEDIPTKDEYTNERVFIPTKDNRPPELKPIVNINDVPILTHQNISAIIAAPGSGKSSICEAICSAAMNKSSDNLGIHVSDEISNVLFIDTERVNLDVWNSYNRINKRAGAVDSDKARIVGLRMIPRLDERKKVITELIQEFKPELIIIDGAGDMVTDTNSLDQAIECRIWFRELTMKYNLSIITTLHPNKGTKNPRGHIGSEIMREAHAVFIIETDGETKTLTNDFEHGKNRNGAKVSTSFTWSTDFNMFVSCEREINANKKSEPHLLLSNDEINALLLDIVKEGTTATDFTNVLKIRLRENHPKAKTGATSLRDFYTWLQVHKYIEVVGTASKKTVKISSAPPTITQTKITE